MSKSAQPLRVSNFIRYSFHFIASRACECGTGAGRGRMRAFFHRHFARTAAAAATASGPAAAAQPAFSVTRALVFGVPLFGFTILYGGSLNVCLGRSMEVRTDGVRRCVALLGAGRNLPLAPLTSHPCVFAPRTHNVSSAPAPVIACTICMVIVVCLMMCLHVVCVHVCLCVRARVWVWVCLVVSRRLPPSAMWCLCVGDCSRRSMNNFSVETLSSLVCAMNSSSNESLHWRTISCKSTR